MIRAINLFILLNLSIFLQGQDIHFSQFYFSPLTFNPSNTGDLEEDFRIVSNFRSQWKAIDRPFQSIGFSYDQQKIIQDRLLNIGVQFVNDLSGDGRLGVNKFLGSLGYNFGYAGLDIATGLQFGLVSKHLSQENLTFPDQFNMGTGQFDPSLSTGDQQLLENLNYLDLNAGFSVGKSFSQKLKLKAHLGLFHFNYPKESFLNQVNRLPMRYVFGLQGQYKVTKLNWLQWNFISMHHAKAKENVFNAMYWRQMNIGKYKISQAFTGIAYRDGIQRNLDAIVFNFGAVYKNYTVGIAYDLNVSDLRNSTQMRGAFEVAIIYKSLNSLTFGKGLPCERF